MMIIRRQAHTRVSYPELPLLADGAPELAKQWHPTRNGTLTPSDFSCGAAYKAWWQCKGGPCGHQHEWPASISDRYKRNSQCPVCRGHAPCHCNSLQVTRQDLLPHSSWPSRYSSHAWDQGTNLIVA